MKTVLTEGGKDEEDIKKYTEKKTYTVNKARS